MTDSPATTGSVARGIGVPAMRRGYVLTAGLLLVMMVGGTLPIPLYVLYEKRMGFGPLWVTVVFSAYVIGTLFALVLLGLSRELIRSPARRPGARSGRSAQTFPLPEVPSPRAPAAWASAARTAGPNGTRCSRWWRRKPPPAGPPAGVRRAQSVYAGPDS